MPKKSKKESLAERLQHDENSWIKLLGSMADFAKYWRRLEAQEKKSIKRINSLEDRIKQLETNLDKLKGSLQSNVGEK